MRKIITTLMLAAVPFSVAANANDTYGQPESQIITKSPKGNLSGLSSDTNEYPDYTLEPKEGKKVAKKTELKPEPLPEPEILPEEQLEETKPVAKTNSEWDFGLLDGVQFGAGVGTTGANFFAGYANRESSYWLIKKFGVRFDYASTDMFDITMDTIADQAFEYVDGLGDIMSAKDTNVKAESKGIMVDFYPFSSSGWRLSGGYTSGNLSFNSTADISYGFDAEFELAGTQYRYNASDLEGVAQFNWDYKGPYVGTGFEGTLYKGLKFYMDMGVVFADKSGQFDLIVPETGLEVFEGGTWNPVAGDTTLTDEFEDLKADALKDANEDISKIDFYPIIKMGLMYRF